MGSLKPLLMTPTQNISLRKGVLVFVELMPLLAGRTVMITVVREDDKTLRVNVIPTTKSGATENPALTTPLSYTGTPEELDADLGKQLASYVECHRALGSTLASAKAEMDAAAKAAQEEARKKAEERRKKAAEKPADNLAAPVTVPTAPRPPETASLFVDTRPAAESGAKVTTTGGGGEEKTHAPG
jgi:PRTRC genetic system protein E